MKVVRNLMVSNPTVKKIGTDTVAFASGTLGIQKIRVTGKAFEALSFMAYPGFERQARKADVTTVADVLIEVDAARRALDDAKLLTAIGGMERLGVTFQTGINGVYNLFDHEGFHYCVYGGSNVLKTTDDNLVRGPVRVVKSVDVAAKLPRKDAKTVSRIIGLAMTYDGHLAAAAPGGSRRARSRAEREGPSHLPRRGGRQQHRDRRAERHLRRDLASHAEGGLERRDALDRPAGRGVGVRVRMDAG